MNKIFRLSSLVTLSSLMVFAIACSATETVEVVKEIEVVKEVDRDKGSLVIYSGRKESLVGPIIEQFQAISGIDVEVKYGSSGEMASLIMSEGTKSPADVFYAQDPGALGSVIDMLQDVSADSLALVPDWAKSNQGKWIGVSGRARTCLLYTSPSPRD